MKLLSCFKSLSTRLLVLTLLWVSFIVMSIGYTMVLNWELEASSAAMRRIDVMRFHVQRAGTFTALRFSSSEFSTEMKAFDNSMTRLKEGDPLLPMAVPKVQAVTQAVAEMERGWNQTVRPMLMQARENNGPVSDVVMQSFITKLTNINMEIDRYRDGYLWQLRYLQGLLIVLAVASLFAIMALLLRWVIRPLDHLGAAIDRLSAGHLDTRLPDMGEDEIGAIAQGFNHMAERLQDSYDNLEQKVNEKTASLAEKTKHFSQLYEMTSYFSQPQTSLEDLLEGFASRIAGYADAEGCAVKLLREKDGGVQIAVTSGLNAVLVRAIDSAEDSTAVVQQVLAAGCPVSSDIVSGRRAEETVFAEDGFVCAWHYPVRSPSAGDLGVVTLYFRSQRTLDDQMIPVLETCCTHLGTAIETNRLIERDRQFAVVHERQLLAQGLHDSIAQALSFLNLQVQFLSDAIKDNDNALRDESLSAIREGVQECYEDVRELLLNFRERIHKEGFIEGVKTVIERFEGQSHVHVKLKQSGTGPELSPRQKMQVIFIIQEALSNVRKHAEAESVEIRIDNSDDLRVAVIDDGKGIDDKLVAERKGQHVGLSIMAERASRIGAQVSVRRASPIGGTRVDILLSAAARHE